jgi:hypothetical protein
VGLKPNRFHVAATSVDSEDVYFERRSFIVISGLSCVARVTGAPDQSRSSGAPACRFRHLTAQAGVYDRSGPAKVHPR